MLTVGMSVVLGGGIVGLEPDAGLIGQLGVVPAAGEQHGYGSDEKKTKKKTKTGTHAITIIARVPRGAQ